MTPAQIQEHYNTDATDAAINRFINAEEAAIDRVLGAVAVQTDSFHYPYKTIVLTRQATSITSVIEDEEVLDADDYELLTGGRLIQRKGWISNTLPWGDIVVVEYVPYDDTLQRTRALTYLVGLNLVQNGYRVERNTEILQEPLDYQRERVRTLRGLKGYPTFA